MTVLGPVRVSRAYYHCRHCHAGHCPRDAALGPTAVDLSRGAAEAVASAGVVSSFAEAARKVLDGSFCQEMLEEALARGTPSVFDTDQGVQFTATAWTSRLERAGVSVSMDGTGRCLDSIFVERLWRSVKYEYAYPCRPETVRELERGLREYFGFYNERRIHQSLEYRTPADVHRQESRRPLEK